MHAVVRHYSGQGAHQLFSEIEAQLNGVEEAIRSVLGVVTYTLLRTDSGGISITICQDKAGADESVRVAAEFISKNCSAQANPPVVSEGATILHINS